MAGERSFCIYYTFGERSITKLPRNPGKPTRARQIGNKYFENSAKGKEKKVLSLKSTQSIRESTCKCDCRKSMMFVSLNSVCVFLVPREWSPVKSMIVRQGHLFVSVTSAPTICAKVIKQKNAHKINGLSQKMGSTITKQKSNNIVYVNITYSKMYIFIYHL